MIYRREEYVEYNPMDQKHPIKNIEALVPVGSGERKFVGEVTLGIQTPFGVQHIPLSFEIPAADINEAFHKFAECAEPQIERARQEIEEEIKRARQAAASRIVRPDEVGFSPSAPAGQGAKIINLKNLKK